MFYVVVFQPKKINEQDRKVFNQEKKHVRDVVLPKLRMPIFNIPPILKNDKAQKMTTEDLSNKITLSKTYLEASIKALVPTFFGLITEIHTNEILLTSVSRSIRMFKYAMKKALARLLLHSAM
jgi:hypothetical protein